MIYFKHSAILHLFYHSYLHNRKKLCHFDYIQHCSLIIYSEIQLEKILKLKNQFSIRKIVRVPATFRNSLRWPRSRLSAVIIVVFRKLFSPYYTSVMGSNRKRKRQSNGESSGEPAKRRRSSNAAHSRPNSRNDSSKGAKKPPVKPVPPSSSAQSTSTEKEKRKHRSRCHKLCAEAVDKVRITALS